MINPFTTVKYWHRKFKFDKEPMDLKKLEFRGSLLSEETDEYHQAVFDKDSEEIVDALIDIIWIACGTLDLLDIDFDKAFREVARANNEKIRGIKPGRENSGGFDVRKPTQDDVNSGKAKKIWSGPNHSGNTGILKEIFCESRD